MPNYPRLLEKQAEQLAPQGRAFNAPEGSTLRKLYRALSAFFARPWADAHAVLDGVIADNANFTVDDATAWELRLGIIPSPGTSLADRIKAINQRIAYPGTTAPRQSGPYLQAQLRAAGFNVYVHGNLSGFAPEDIIGAAAATYHSTTLYHGPGVYHGSAFSNKIANSIEESRDASFPIGANYFYTFFIAGPTLSTYATVPLARKNEFRQLVLQLKPANMVGLLFVNYA